MEMTVQLDLEYAQVKKLVEQLGPDDQKRLTVYLEKRTLKEEIKAFRRKARSVVLTDEEIREEVEAVRRERYEREHSH